MCSSWSECNAVEGITVLIDLNAWAQTICHWTLYILFYCFIHICCILCCTFFHRGKKHQKIHRVSGHKNNRTFELDWMCPSLALHSVSSLNMRHDDGFVLHYETMCVTKCHLERGTLWRTSNTFILSLPDAQTVTLQSLLPLTVYT